MSLVRLEGLLFRFGPYRLTQIVVLRGAFVAASGIAAQAIPFLAMPFLTRIYDPSAFGLYTIFASLITCIGSFAPMKFDIATSVAKSTDHARSLWQASAIATVGCSTVVLIAGHLNPALLESVNISPSGSTWSVVLLASGMVAAIQFNNGWLLHAHAYIAIGCSKLLRGVAFVSFAVLLLKLGYHDRGLAFAYCSAALVAAFFSTAIAIVKGLRPLKVRGIQPTVRRYLDFPLKAALPSALDMIALTLPLLAVSRLYSLNDAAMFGLFRQGIVAPFSLIAGAFGQVLMRQVADLAASRQKIHRLVANTAVVLAGISALVVTAILLEGPSIFAFIYGSKWPEAGSIAVILIVPAGLQFVTSALSITLIALRKLNWLAYWQTTYFFAIFVLISLEPTTMRHFLYGLATVDILMSLAYLAVVAFAVAQYEAETSGALA